MEVEEEEETVSVQAINLDNRARSDIVRTLLTGFGVSFQTRVEKEELQETI